MNPTELVTPLEALATSGLDIIASEPGFEHGKPNDPAMVAAAELAAKSADVVLLYLGLDEIAESEGKDRDHMELPANQQELLARIAAVNSQVVVVLAAGSAIEMPWLGSAQALLHGYLGGQAGAQAMVNAITGVVNPSGRLAETYPISLADTPTANYYPAESKHALYREGPFVGYRYYTTAGKDVLFPFGFGLSYTSFAYSDLAVTATGATVTVTNTGAVAGADVAQLYVSGAADVALLGPAPRIELKGFRKVFLAPGESAQVAIDFDEYTFRTFDAAADRWVTVAGDYEVAIGRSVTDLVASATLTVAGEQVAAASAASGIENYRTAQVQSVTDEEFAALLGHALPAPQRTDLPLTANSPLSDMQYARSPLARAIHKHYLVRGLAKAEAKGVPDLNIMFQNAMPFRAIAKMSGGMADMAMVDGILTLVNGKFFRGLGQVIKQFFGNRKRQKALKNEFLTLAAGSTSNSVEGK